MAYEERASEPACLSIVKSLRVPCPSAPRWKTYRLEFFSLHLREELVSEKEDMLWDYYGWPYSALP